ncbi:hypothetical protein GCM10023185_03080 [Hymenobacter saemangeumensis]|uniref:T9SS type A sorting domain-containing protein n=2 Tax=Hymenobacter saemangeumensis TaxID=1084522 RepID=A0ABP8HZ70_9BACT
MLVLCALAAQPAQAQRLVRERLLSGLRQSQLNIYRLQLTPANNLLVQGISSQAPGTGCNSTLNDNFLLSSLLDTVWTQRGPALSGGWSDITWMGRNDFVIFGDQQRALPGATQCTERDFFMGRYAADTRSARWTQTFNPGTGSRLSRVGKLTPALDGGFFVSGSSMGGMRKSWQLVKTDSLGQPLWVRNYGISFTEVPFLLQTNQRTNRLLMAGTGQYGAPYHLIKLRLMLLNQQGDSLRNAFISPMAANWSISSVSNHITQLRDGGFLIPAQADSTSNTTGALISQPIMIKVDSMLQLQWYHLERLAPGQRMQYGGKVCELADGTLLTLLSAQNTASASNSFVVQRLLGHTGKLSVAYPFVSTACSAVSSYDLVPGPDGRTVYVGGSCFTSAGSRGYVAVIDLQNLPVVVNAPLSTAATQADVVFTLAPNPAHGTAKLSWQLPAGRRAGRLQLYTTLGQVVREVALPAGAAGSLELSNLAAGTYLVRMLDVDGAALGRTQRQVILP